MPLLPFLMYLAKPTATCPSDTFVVTGPGNAVLVTVAVSVIAVPAATLLADTLKVVVVDALAPFARGPTAKSVPISSTTTLLRHVFRGIKVAIPFASSPAPISKNARAADAAAPRETSAIPSPVNGF